MKKVVDRFSKQAAVKTRLLSKRVALKLQVITVMVPHRRVLEMQKLTLPTRTDKKLKNERVKARL